MNQHAYTAGLQSRLHAGVATHRVDEALALLHLLFKRFDGQLVLRLWQDLRR